MLWPFKRKLHKSLRPVSRELSDYERRVIRRFVSGDLEGDEELLQQIGHARVIGECKCGCASIQMEIGFPRDGWLYQLEILRVDGQPIQVLLDPADLEVQRDG